ncbi:MAG: maleylacetoacetate isomerase [Paucibacter sp.]|nr:maleylacetoacetate isomerase [Roseateles sp.]
MELYNYFRSSASWRVRIALALKGLGYDYRGVHLLRNEQMAAEFGALTPAQLVPLLRDGDALISQSMAIIEYLDETHPEPPLLPSEPVARAQVRALAQDIACEIHPLNNLRVLRYLVKVLGLDEERKSQWIRHWVEGGLAVVEQRLQKSAGRFCFGDEPGMADCLLVPQVFNAHRTDCNLDGFPTILRINEHCLSLPAFADTHPSKCPDAE